MKTIFVVAARRGNKYGVARFAQLNLNPKDFVLVEVLDAQEVEARCADDFGWFRHQMAEREAEAVVIEAEALQDLNMAIAVSILVAKPKVLVPLCGGDSIWPMGQISSMLILPAPEPKTD